MEKTLGELAKPYVKRLNAYNALEKRIEQLNAQLKELKHPFWKEELIEPIAEEMIKHFPDRYYEILGPFGLSAELSIHFYKKGVDEKHRFEGDNCVSISFRPEDLDKGELSIVNNKKDTGRFAKGTLGEINGFNYPVIQLSPDTTIDELLQYVRR